MTNNVNEPELSVNERLVIAAVYLAAAQQTSR